MALSAPKCINDHNRNPQEYSDPALEEDGLISVSWSSAFKALD